MVVLLLLGLDPEDGGSSFHRNDDFIGLHGVTSKKMLVSIVSVSITENIMKHCCFDSILNFMGTLYPVDVARIPEYASLFKKL